MFQEDILESWRLWVEQPVVVNMTIFQELSMVPFTRIAAGVTVHITILKDMLALLPALLTLLQSNLASARLVPKIKGLPAIVDATLHAPDRAV